MEPDKINLTPFREAIVDDSTYQIFYRDTPLGTDIINDKFLKLMVERYGNGNDTSKVKDIKNRVMKLHDGYPFLRKVAFFLSRPQQINCGEIVFGTELHALDKKFLQREKITHVLNLSGLRGKDSSAQFHEEEEFQQDGRSYHLEYKSLEINELINNNNSFIKTAIDQLDKWLEGGIARGENPQVFVHSVDMDKKTAKVMIAYLMKKRDFSLGEAKARVYGEIFSEQIDRNKHIFLQENEAKLKWTPQDDQEIEKYIEMTKPKPPEFVKLKPFEVFTQRVLSWLTWPFIGFSDYMKKIYEKSLKESQSEHREVEVKVEEKEKYTVKTKNLREEMIPNLKEPPKEHQKIDDFEGY